MSHGDAVRVSAPRDRAGGRRAQPEHGHGTIVSGRAGSKEMGSPDAAEKRLGWAKLHSIEDGHEVGVRAGVALVDLKGRHAGSDKRCSNAEPFRRASVES